MAPFSLGEIPAGDGAGMRRRQLGGDRSRLSLDARKVAAAVERYDEVQALAARGLGQRDETIAECLQRELREELGVESAVDGILDVTAGYRYPRVEVVLRAHLSGPMGTFSDEVIEARYFALAELPPLRIDQRKLIERALEAAR